MELESLFGLPAHPLLVHGAVVLIPLAALGTIAIAVSAETRRRIGWIVVVAAFVSFGFALLAKGSGESLEELVEETELVEEHAEKGESLPWLVLPIALTATGVMVLDRQRKDDDTDGAEPSWLGPAVTAMAVAAILASVLGTARTFQVGDSGAKATWQDIQDGAERGG